MINVNSKKGSLSDVVVLQQGSNLTLGTDVVASMGVALDYAIKSGFSRVTEINSNSISLEKDAGLELTKSKVFNDFKKFANGSSVTTPLHDYSVATYEAYKDTKDDMEDILSEQPWVETPDLPVKKKSKK